MRAIVGMVLGMLSLTVAGAQTLQPLDDADLEFSDGMCAIVSGEDVMLDGAVKIGGTLIELGRPVEVTANSKTWRRDGFEARFLLPEGELLESPEEYRLGMGPPGVLVYSFNGQGGELNAREVCFTGD